VLLAIATVLIAWSAYQNSEWVRERFVRSDSAAELAAEAREIRLAAELDQQWDRSVFVAWLTALDAGDPSAMLANDALFRDETRASIEEWRSIYDDDPDAALLVDPFTLPGYDVPERRNDARTLVAQAAADSRQSRAASRNGASFALLMVFFAGALTFVGLTQLFHDRRVRWLVLALAGLVLLGGLVVLISLPIRT
jgi:hypothetical protein